MIILKSWGWDFFFLSSAAELVQPKGGALMMICALLSLIVISLGIMLRMDVISLLNSGSFKIIVVQSEFC